MTETLAAAYDPNQYEEKLYDFWMQHKLFRAVRDPSRKPYTILMPPPNVTSQLHMGHGTGYSMQDILVRWKRMSGYNALWLPGTDHAGIATQMMVEKSLEAEGKTRQELGREAFTERLQEWKDKYGGLILKQFRSMGFSCDWDRLAYTMDPQLSSAVRRIFVDLYNDGLIYRGERLVNWDPVLKTAVSDDELDNQEIQGHLWHLVYPIDGSDESITVATTRPETMFGDTAVAVNPTDERYTHLIGKIVRLPLVDRLIPVVADSYVKSEFGTGAVKITPAHDPNDFELGKRHDLPRINVMTDAATMNDQVPERFRGLARFAARKEVVRAFKELGLLAKEEPYKTTVPISERSKEIIEPRLSKQWYVAMRKLAEPAIAAAKDGKLRFHPDLWKKTYLHWLENIQDWCISRQLWWGHRIPIWYCRACQGTSTGMTDPTACSHCGSKDLRQDEDVLDTWFSSWLWPISPFGWPDKSEDLDYFYPTDVLVTAPEIIFLWVARMVMVGLKTRGEVPFRDVFLTPTVCDKQGRKFSKTLGNGIDPLQVIAKYGTDAVRFTAVQLAPIGGRTRMSPEDFEAGGRFINKLWNASRFLLGYIKPGEKIAPLDPKSVGLSGQWLLNELAEAADRIDKALNSYRINDAADHVYHLIWGSFCDWGLETAKSALAGADEKTKSSTISLLVYVLDGILRLASPIMPFVTEEIWQKLPNHPDWDRPVSLTVAQFPHPSKLRHFSEAAGQWALVQSLVSEIRSVRSQSGIAPKLPLKAFVRTSSDLAGLFEGASTDICRLASLGELSSGPEVTRPGKSLAAVGRGFEAFIPADGIIDIAKEQARLKTEVTRISKILAGIEAKLANPNFTDRAPTEVLEQTKAQRDNMRFQLESLQKNLETLA
ncbi:MAG: valine--tRNA ligase [Deltaproteobacteria bacterium]|nr:valine--tRNA ligase [Deltaproteobacteria bacterium]